MLVPVGVTASAGPVAIAAVAHSTASIRATAMPPVAIAAPPGLAVVAAAQASRAVVEAAAVRSVVAAEAVVAEAVVEAAVAVAVADGAKENRT